MSEIITYQDSSAEKYTHDQWAKRNGIFGFKIVDAAKTDTMVQWFYEVMRQAPYITPSDQRLALSYGYFVHLGLMTQDQASAICGIEITPYTKEQIIAIILPEPQE
jgi:hypothetical protein